MIRLTLLVIILTLQLQSWAQTQIKGSVNDYFKVVHLFNRQVCGDSIVLQNSYGLTLGDEVLIIQMQGASLNRSATSSFGEITSLSNCGNYEIQQISSISRNSIILSGNLKRNYSAAGKVQLIRIAKYGNATTNRIVTGQAWNGNNGGVIVIHCDTNFTVNHNIDISGKGFKGAPK